VFGVIATQIHGGGVIVFSEDRKRVRVEIRETIVEGDGYRAFRQRTGLESVNRLIQRQDGAMAPFQTLHPLGEDRPRQKQIAIPLTLVTIRNTVIAKDQQALVTPGTPVCSVECAQATRQPEKRLFEPPGSPHLA